jgi:tRNA nucleotidyltransferase (CCA-adding enzyme)
MDAMAEISDREGIAGDDRAVLIFAALTHDLAKSRVEDGGTTQLRYSGPGLRWTSHGHEQAGGPMAREFLNSIGIKRSIVDRVVPLVENHLQHVHLASKKQIQTRKRTGAGAVRRLASRLSPATVRELALLVEADHSGRPPLPQRLPEDMRALVRIAEAEGVMDGPPRRLVEGRDVIPYFGGRTGPHIGRAVAATHDAYLSGAVDTAAEALLWVREYVRKEASLVRGDDVLAHTEPGPEVRKALEAAWDAQLAGEFADEAGGKEWLERYFEADRAYAPPGWTG